MTFALICATRFEFIYDKNERIPLRTKNNEDFKQEEYQSVATSNTIKLMQIIQIFTTLKNGTFLFIAW
jgi:hypothetical protein